MPTYIPHMSAVPNRAAAVPNRAAARVSRHSTRRKACSARAAEAPVLRVHMFI